jgi:hypothetical protein
MGLPDALRLAVLATDVDQGTGRNLAIGQMLILDRHLSLCGAAPL